MKSVRSAAAICVALFSILLFGGVAHAQAPANDTAGNAVAVTAIPFSASADTTQATTDADDAQFNAACGAPATDASVWYAVTPSTSATLVVDVSQSDYSAGVLVGTGTPGSLSLVACGPGAVGFSATAGTTYYVLAIDDQQNGDGLNGGQLNISISEVAVPTVNVTVNRVGSFNSRTGYVTISGTYSCTSGSSINVFVDARQNAGRFVVLGYGSFYDANTCDGSVRPWSAVVQPTAGKFAGGKALTVTFSFACGQVECATGYVEQTVLLTGKKSAGAAEAGDDGAGNLLFLPALGN